MVPPLPPPPVCQAKPIKGGFGSSGGAKRGGGGATPGKKGGPNKKASQAPGSGQKSGTTDSVASGAIKKVAVVRTPVVPNPLRFVMMTAPVQPGTLVGGKIK
jgi:hypothetical protein